MNDEEPCWMIHLPTTLTSPDAVTQLTAALRGSLAHVTVLDFGEVSISEEDDQTRRRYVCCDLSLGGDRRRVLPDGHPGPCDHLRRS